jgi:amino acid adenylation domain-containing protein
LEYLERSARQFPEKTAFLDEHTSVTFAQLRQQAMALGSFIIKARPGTGPVLVFMEKSVREAVGFLATLYSGSFYCPVDATIPDLRVRNMITTLQPKLVLTSQALLPRAQGILAAAKANVPAVVIEEHLFCRVEEDLLAAAQAGIVASDPVYAIFTSGSTGVPKGVCTSHGALRAFIEEFTQRFELSHTDVLGNQAPFDFDVSAKDIYTALKTGATLCLIPRKMFSFPKQLIDFFQLHRVTTLIWAVSALSITANAKAFSYAVPTTLRRVMFSGEVLPVKHLNYWREHLPEAMFVNLYAPTEITGNCLYYIVDRPFAETEQLPLGQPFAHMDVLVLDEENRPIGPGQLGELVVRGPSMALGYYNNPEQTARAFVQNPLQNAYPERVYRTGDLARRTEQGELLFSSRKDFQIKHMGHRIELAEVELAVNSLDDIQAAVCLYDTKEGKIVLVYQGGASAKDILNGLKPVLPKYMFPQVFRQVDAMPYTKNLKVDRVKLRGEYLHG